MSGGGNRPLKGRMSSKLRSDVTPQQLTKLEGDLNRDEKALRVSEITLNSVSNPRSLSLNTVPNYRGFPLSPLPHHKGFPPSPFDLFRTVPDVKTS